MHSVKAIGLDLALSAHAMGDAVLLAVTSGAAAHMFDCSTAKSCARHVRLLTHVVLFAHVNKHGTGTGGTAEDPRGA